jgi:hypothetical protein
MTAKPLCLNTALMLLAAAAVLGSALLMVCAVMV